MLTTTRSPDKLAFGKKNISKSTSSRNDNSKLAAGKNNNNSEVDRFAVGRNSMEHIKKSKKLKSEKMSKS